MHSEQSALKSLPNRLLTPHLYRYSALKPLSSKFNEPLFSMTIRTTVSGTPTGIVASISTEDEILAKMLEALRHH